MMTTYTCKAFFFLIIAFTSLTSEAQKNSESAVGNFEKDIEYGHNINSDGKDQSLTMDVYWPPNAEKKKKYPLLLLIHPGGFINGTKEMMTRACRSIADSGFVAVTINYRLGFKAPAGCDGDLTGMMKATYRASQDARAAMRFLIDNASKYHIDKNWVFIGGASAGGATAISVIYVTQASYDNEYPEMSKELGDLDKGSNSSKATFKVKGLCNMWGAMADSNAVNSSNVVPAIFFHGTKDPVAPFNYGPWIRPCPNSPRIYGSSCIYRRTQVYGKPAILNYIVGGVHTPKEYNPEQIMSNTACFFHSVMRGDAHSGTYSDVVTGCR